MARHERTLASLVTLVRMMPPGSPAGFTLRGRVVTGTRYVTTSRYTIKRLHAILSSTLLKYTKRVQVVCLSNIHPPLNQNNVTALQCKGRKLGELSQRWLFIFTNLTPEP